MFCDFCQTCHDGPHVADTTPISTRSPWRMFVEHVIWESVIISGMLFMAAYTLANLRYWF